MTDGGIILYLVGVLLAMATPADRAIAVRRHYRGVERIFSITFASSYRFAPPPPLSAAQYRGAPTLLIERGRRAVAAAGLFDRA